jgi:hypothetical protein
MRLRCLRRLSRVPTGRTRSPCLKARPREPCRSVRRCTTAVCARNVPYGCELWIPAYQRRVPWAASAAPVHHHEPRQGMPSCTRKRSPSDSCTRTQASKTGLETWSNAFSVRNRLPRLDVMVVPVMNPGQVRPPRLVSRWIFHAEAQRHQSTVTTFQPTTAAHSRTEMVVAKRTICRSASCWHGARTLRTSTCVL